MALVWKCPIHGEVTISFCRAVSCECQPEAIPDPAGYYPGEVWDDKEGDVGMMLTEQTVQRAKKVAKERSLSWPWKLH